MSNRSIVFIDLIYRVQTLSSEIVSVLSYYTIGDTQSDINPFYVRLFCFTTTFTFPRYPPRGIKNVTYHPRRRSILLIIIINTRLFFLAYQNSINYLEFDLHCRCGRSLAVIIDFARQMWNYRVERWLRTPLSPYFR